MTRRLLITTTFISGLLIANAGMAGDSPYPYGKASRMAESKPMQGRMPPPPMRSPRQQPGMMEFPTPQELSRMLPPDPITEADIQERFAKRREHINEMLERDRQAATRYAQDYARYQKAQSDRLAEMMARAEERRKSVLKRLEEQEQRALEYFRQRNAPAETQSAGNEPGKAETAK